MGNWQTGEMLQPAPMRYTILCACGETCLSGVSAAWELSSLELRRRQLPWSNGSNGPLGLEQVHLPLANVTTTRVQTPEKPAFRLRLSEATFRVVW